MGCVNVLQVAAMSEAGLTVQRPSASFVCLKPWYPIHIIKLITEWLRTAGLFSLDALITDSEYACKQSLGLRIAR